MQHQEFINALNGTLTTVLCIEIFDQDESNDDDEDDEGVLTAGYKRADGKVVTRKY